MATFKVPGGEYGWDTEIIMKPWGLVLYQCRQDDDDFELANVYLTWSQLAELVELATECSRSYHNDK